MRRITTTGASLGTGVGLGLVLLGAALLGKGGVAQPALEHGRQLFAVDRLGQEVIHPGLTHRSRSPGSAPAVRATIGSRCSGFSRSRNARVAACDDHGIRVDGKFAVVCRDKIGNFHAGCVEPRIPSDRPFTLAEAVRMVQPLIRDRGQRLTVAAAADLPACLGERRAIVQVLINLLSNAAKFTHLGTITLIAERAGERIRLTVEDTGIGMSPAQAEKVFDAFHQVDASTTRQVGGTGLGLTISRRLCQLLGGDISLHSVPGQGSSFTIDLPARAGPQPRPAIA